MYLSHLCESDEGENSHSCKHDGGNQHHHSWANVGAEEGDGSQPAAERNNQRATAHLGPYTSIWYHRVLYHLFHWKLFLPHSPARDAHSLDNTDHHLGHEDEEESHEVERAVSPAGKETLTSEMSQQEEMCTLKGESAYLKAL